MGVWFPLIITLLVAISSSIGMLSAVPGNSTSISGGGFKASLRRVDSGGNLTRLERLRRAMNRELAASNDVRSKVVPVKGEFLIGLSIGNPPVQLEYVLDAASDMIWTQCLGTSAIYHHETSSSFSQVLCSDDICHRDPKKNDLDFLSCPGGGNKGACAYNRGYADGSVSSQGVMAKETFTFDNGASRENVYFGCGQLYGNNGSPMSPADGASGIVGLSRGRLSLVSQLGMPTFWYCLPDIESPAASTLSVGSPAGVLTADSSAAVTTTPFLHSTYPWYMVLLKGITVGVTALVPEQESSFETNLDGSRGMVIDSGTTFTRLHPAVYTALKNELIKQLLQAYNLQVAEASAGLDLCFALPPGGGNTNVVFPELTFHFDRGDLVIPKENYMETVESSTLACLAILSAGEGVPMAIFGNMQQKNMIMTFNLIDNYLSFQPTQCDQ